MNCCKHNQNIFIKNQEKFEKNSKQMPYFYTPKSQDQGQKSVEDYDILSVSELFIEEKCTQHAQQLELLQELRYYYLLYTNPFV